jgi:outer membrane protein
MYIPFCPYVSYPSLGVCMRSLLLGCAVAFFLVVGGFSTFAQQAAPESAPAPASPAASPPVVTLEQCVEAAKSAAPGLKVAGLTLDNARALLLQTQGANGLALGGSAGYFHQGPLPGSSSIFAGASASTTSPTLLDVNSENVQGGLSLSGPNTSVDLTAQHAISDSASSQASALIFSGSQTVFDGYPGSRASANVQLAGYTYKTAQVTYDASMKSLLYQVKQAYYTLLADQNTVQVRRATVAQASQNVAYMQGQFSVQRATKLDVLQVQVTLDQAQLDLRAAGNTVETDRKKLSLAIGWPLDKQYQVAESAAPEPPSLDPAAALKTAFENRSELKTLALGSASANVSLRLYRSQFYPLVSLTGSLNVGQDWTKNAYEGAFTAGAKVALPPLYDGGQRSALLKQASDQLSSLAVQVDQQRQSISIDVANALFGVKDARDRLDLAKLNVEQAQGQYDLTKAKHAQGLETTLDLITAFAVLTTAQVGQVQAGSNYALAILNLNNVMGL